MPYANLVGVDCADSHEEMFMRFRDFLCKRNGTYDYSTTGIGWTLHDSSYAIDEDNISDNDWFVVYSAGESGEEDMYMRFKFYHATTSWLMTSGYLYWDNSTHAGSFVFSTALGTATFTKSTDHVLYIFGDLDSFVVAQEYGVTAIGEIIYFGRLLPQLYGDELAISSGSLSSGSAVSITLDAVPSTWKVGQNIYIRDDDHTEIITIISIGGNVITADLVNSYTANCKLRAEYQWVVGQGNSFPAAYGFPVRQKGLTMGGTAAYNTFDLGLRTCVTSNIPDILNSDYLMQEIDSHDTNPDAYYGRLRNIYYTTTNAKTHLDILTNPNGDEFRYFKAGNYYFMVKEV